MTIDNRLIVRWRFKAKYAATKAALKVAEKMLQWVVRSWGVNSGVGNLAGDAIEYTQDARRIVP